MRARASRQQHQQQREAASMVRKSRRGAIDKAAHGEWREHIAAARHGASTHQQQRASAIGAQTSAASL